MLIGNVLVSAIYIGACLLSKNPENRLRNLLFITMALALFVNIGYFISTSIMYETFGSLFFLVVWFASRGRAIGKLKLNKQAMASISCLIFLSLLASIKATVMDGDVKIIPITTQMDDVYYGQGSTVTPTLSHTNLTMLAYLLLFVCLTIAASDVFSRGTNREWIINKLEISFRVFFVCGVIEFVINNFVQPYLIREAVYGIFGVADPTRAYDGAARNGWYGFSLLFTEQSYIIVVLAYYVIQLLRSDTSLDGIIWTALSLPILYMNGSSTGVMLMPLGLVTLVYLLSKRFRRHASVFSLIGVVLLVVGAAYYLSTQQGSKLIEYTSTRMHALLSGGTYSTTAETSSAIRNMGNSIALDAWLHSPFIGLGLGTTRAYGLVTSALVSLGIVGCLLYLSFIKEIFGIQRLSPHKVFIFLIITMYLTLGLSIAYLYSPALLVFILPFIPTSAETSVEMQSVMNRKAEAVYQARNF